MARLMELNADVGEGGADALLMPYVDRVSIACGGHAGDAASMRQALLLARDLGVMAGAHPAFPDRENFGRTPMRTDSAQLKRWIVEQTLALEQIAASLDMTLFHVKPHGALYAQAAVDRAAADALIEAMQVLGGLALVVLAGSPLAGWAKAAGVETLEEAFADRRYLRSGQLAPRDLPNAVIEHPEQAAAQARALALGLPVATLEGEPLALRAQTICLHGDLPGAAERAKAIARALAV
jgi:5-oxoprolinase (ATP-hydrolysing) subunit A